MAKSTTNIFAIRKMDCFDTVECFRDPDYFILLLGEGMILYVKDRVPEFLERLVEHLNLRTDTNRNSIIEFAKKFENGEE